MNKYKIELYVKSSHDDLNNKFARTLESRVFEFSNTIKTGESIILNPKYPERTILVDSVSHNLKKNYSILRAIESLGGDVDEKGFKNFVNEYKEFINSL